MAKRWNKTEEHSKKKELKRLYIKENKTIDEIAEILNISESSVYRRLLRLGITPIPFKKQTYRNINHNIIIPQKYSEDLAEFVGALLGDGHITPTQVTITLGTKDKYADHISVLMENLFGVKPKVAICRNNEIIVYIGSTALVRWFLKMGLVFNKVKEQVNIPPWCMSNKRYMQKVVRGLIDTDGSVYKLKYGIQISFCNRSLPLSRSVRNLLVKLGFNPSRISGYNLYLTRRSDLFKYFNEIGFGNKKHEERFLEFANNGRLVE